jgi:peroxiredoxin
MVDEDSSDVGRSIEAHAQAMTVLSRDVGSKIDAAAFKLGQQARLLKILVWLLAVHAGFGFLVMVALGAVGVMGFLASREAIGRQVRSDSAALVGKPLPGFRLEDQSGTQVTNREVEGKVVLLNFWATWCPPCRLEMPSMERLYGEFRDQGLEIVAVNFMESGEQVRAFAEEQKLTYPMLLDKEAEIAGRYGVMRLPVSVLIGREGEVIAKAIGFKDWYKDDIRELVAALLGDGPIAGAAAAENGAEEPLSEGYSLGVFAGVAGLVVAGFALLRIRRRRARRLSG